LPRKRRVAIKKPYQIEAQRAVKQFEAMATDGSPAVQMMLPLAEMVGWLRKGVGELVRQAGLQLMELFDAGGGPGIGWRAEPTAVGSDGNPVGQ
jgi:hypothetical protein